ncbi:MULTISPECIES: hypothetical protein [Pectobacterium]|uniref:hypothetical protein n=1 Tax=Pectobacterium TaxID=122277 RepID=UPI0032EDAF27
MMKQEKIEAVMEELAKQQGHGLNGQDRFVLRTRIAATLAAKERHRQRMNSEPYEWKRPSSKR